MRYNIQDTIWREKKKVATAAIEPRPLQQRVESVLKETNTNEIKNERQAGVSMEFDLIDDEVQAPDVDAMRRWMWIAPSPMLIDKWNV